MAARDAEPDRDLLIYGAGAVGSLLGARLALAGERVTLLGRPALRQAVAARGLRVALPEGERRVDLPVVTTLDELARPPATVLLTVKAYAVEHALPDLRALDRAGTTIVSLQNGVGVEEALAPELARLAGGAFTLSVAAPAVGVVRQETHGGGLALAPVHGAVRLEELAGRLASAGLPCALAADYRRVKWSKLLLNLLGNAGAALLALPPRAIFADPKLFAVERRALLEALAVMRAQRLAPLALPGFNVPLLARAMRLPGPLARWLVGGRAARGRGDKPPSLLLELERGREQTEIDWLNGAVAAYGARHGVSTPVNAALTELVNQAARDPARRLALVGNRALFLDEIARLTAQQLESGDVG